MLAECTVPGLMMACHMSTFVPGRLFLRLPALLLTVRQASMFICITALLMQLSAALASVHMWHMLQLWLLRKSKDAASLCPTLHISHDSIEARQTESILHPEQIGLHATGDAPLQNLAATEQVFITKRVNDPNLVPMLLAHGVRFGAVKVRPVTSCA